VALAEELASEGIWVNAVAPSTMDTPQNREAMPKADFARWPKLDEVAEVAVFLASPGNRAARGGIVPVFGKG
jgi:NAD(P)-dependent dehydrogenase (short-subunit alcohol dehydrogenase family)